MSHHFAIFDRATAYAPGEHEGCPHVDIAHTHAEGLRPSAKAVSEQKRVDDVT